MTLDDLKNLFPQFQVDNFDHVLGHISKAAGKLHGLAGDADHISEDRLIDRDVAFGAAEIVNGKAARVYIADLVICAAKLAALCPSGEFDLEQAVQDRIAEKKDYRAQYAAKPPETVTPNESASHSPITYSPGDGTQITVTSEGSRRVQPQEPK